MAQDRRRAGFVQVCSDGWVKAEIAFGTDAQQARAAGDRTYAFYTGTGA